MACTCDRNPGRALATALVVIGAVSLGALEAAAGPVDSTLAGAYFREAAALCEREGGRLWGVSLCGPMVMADATTKTIATNQPAPDAPWPAAFGYANSAQEWGGVRWSTYVWSGIPADDAHARARLLMHELFHRIQPELGFVIREGRNDHLETPEGRYWMQLEWRALARALAATGAERLDAVRDALAFRAERRSRLPDAAENERLLEVNEGLAQYTGTVAAAASWGEAAADAIDQLGRAPQNQTFVRTFAYPSGAAYGLLLDLWSPAWTRKVKDSDDLGQLLREAAQVVPAEDADRAAERYEGAKLLAAEETREAERKLRVAELRRRFVDGPVVVLPGGGNFSFMTAGITPIPEAGTIYPGFRVTSDWGSLEAAQALLAPDRSTTSVPGPATIEGGVLRGDGWTITLAPGWKAVPGSREGDLRIEGGTAR